MDLGPIFVYSLLLLQDLMSQVSAETDPVSLLPKVVSLLYIQVSVSESLCELSWQVLISSNFERGFLLQFYNKALQAPGRAISVAVMRLKVRWV